MAYTAAQIKQTADARLAAGATAQQIKDEAIAKGVSLADLSGAYGMDSAGGTSWFAKQGVDVGDWGGTPAPTTAYAPASQPTVSGYTTGEIRDTVNARLGAGASASDIWNEAQAKKVGLADLSTSFGMSLDDGKKWFTDRGVDPFAAPSSTPSASTAPVAAQTNAPTQTPAQSLVAAPYSSSNGFNSTTTNYQSLGQPSMSVQPREAATNWSVAPNQTVANQIESIIAKDSPLMQQARMRALQSQNASGRLNSTMAASAGEAAVYDAAMPIATADARTYADAGQFNATNQSTFSRDFNNWQRERDMANFNVSANDWADERNMGRTTNLANLAEQRDARSGDRNLQREIELRGVRSADSIASDQSNNTNEDATLRRGYINSVTQARGEFADKLSAITQDPNMSSDLKGDAIKDLRGTYNRTITNFATLLGWRPEDWIIQIDEPQTGAAATPAETPAATPVSGTTAPSALNREDNSR